MFDTLPVQGPELRAAGDAEVVAAIEGWDRLEAAAAGRRLAAIAELIRRRCGGDDERAWWACDPWDAAAAEIAAAQTVSQGRACAQMELAVVLRDRLPRVAALLMSGRVSLRLVAVMAARTALVSDPEILAVLDTELAERADQWGPLSAEKLQRAVDVWVQRHDPGALRRARDGARSRDFTVGDPDPGAGTTPVWGRLHSIDAALLQRRLSEMAREVCAEDPRTLDQRRADAVGALAAGATQLTCRCGRPECPWAGQTDPRAAAVTITVLTEPATLDAATSGQQDSTPADNENEIDNDAPAPAAEPATAPARPRPAAVIVGGPTVPPALLAELIAHGAKLRRLPGIEALGAEAGYRPSAALERFVRMRDLTCRFPGCDRPAEYCDIDHAVAWPYGATHPGDLRCLCRKHHLLKTFWTGPGGWSDRQLADGTIIWTAPTGTRYLTRPGATLLFPHIQWATAPPPTPAQPPPHARRGLMMPTRRRPRAVERARRIATERTLNDAHVAERNKPPPF